LCQNCKERIASVHFTQIINSNKTEMYLCEQCAKAKSEFSIVSNLNINDFFTGLIGMGNASMYDSMSLHDKYVCDKCGMSYEEFQSIGKLGCENCYSVFSERLNPILKRLHGNVAHSGKMPAAISESVNISREIDRLKELLNKSIQNEEYEKAAKLRDEIRRLEGEEV